jgi:putative flippase GtrA
MKRHIYSARDFLLSLIDFFHPPFRRIMNLQTFRYAATGGMNMVLGFILYFITFKYILKEQNLSLGFYELKAHVAALFISFCFNFTLGFLLMRYVVFSDSFIPARVQLFRYLMVCLFNLSLNYILLKILVEKFHVYAVFAQVMTTVVVIILSYLGQKHFSFKTDTKEEGIIN